MKTTARFVLGLLIILICPSRVLADYEISAYTARFEVIPNSPNIRVTLDITYNVFSGLKESGFKFVGRNAVAGVSAEDGNGNDRLRGRGNFDRALRGIELLKHDGIEVTVNMTVSKANWREVEDTARMAAVSADRFCIARFVPIDKAKPLGEADALSPGELRALFRTLSRLRASLREVEIPLRDPLWHYFLHAPARRTRNCVHGCSVGYNGLTADADGTVYPCRRLPIPLGNLRDNDFLSIWRDSPVLHELRDRNLLRGKCGRCTRRWLCGGCRGIAYALTGDYLAEDPQCFRPPTIRERLVRRNRGAVSC